MTKKQPTIKQPTFAQQYAELEQIASWFDRGDVALEDALTKFERGLQLAGALQEQLHAVDTRIADIKKKFSSTSV